jgi:hypothetical protein
MVEVRGFRWYKNRNELLMVRKGIERQTTETYFAPAGDKRHCTLNILIDIRWITAAFSQRRDSRIVGRKKIVLSESNGRV